MNRRKLLTIIAQSAVVAPAALALSLLPKQALAAPNDMAVDAVKPAASAIQGVVHMQDCTITSPELRLLGDNCTLQNCHINGNLVVEGNYTAIHRSIFDVSGNQEAGMIINGDNVSSINDYFNVRSTREHPYGITVNPKEMPKLHGLYIGSPNDRNWKAL